jgi:hypothetical protein
MLRAEITKKVKKLLLFGGDKYINAILSRKLDHIGSEPFDIQNSYYTFT